jgi:hypothetical protein
LGQFALDRRQLLTGAGGSAGGALSGCLDAKERATDTEKLRDVEDSPVPDRPDGSFRQGNTVFYTATGGGPYGDLEAAVADVPPGGTLWLDAGEYRVSEEGRIAPDRPIQVRGMGWQLRADWVDHLDSPGRKDIGGTKIVNTGPDTVDESPIEFSAPDIEKFKRGLSIRDLAVAHDGPTTPIVDLERFIYSRISDCLFDTRHKAPVGIRFGEQTFFARVERCKVTDPTEYGIRVTKPTGFGYVFRDNHIRGDKVGIQTETQRTVVTGGQVGANAPNDLFPDTQGVGIRFYARENRQTGGLVVAPGFEKASIGIEIDGENESFADVHVYQTKLPIYGVDRNFGLDLGVRFGKAMRAKVFHPTLFEWGTPENTTPLAEWSSESKDCGIFTDASSLSGLTYTNHGATNPYVKIDGPATNDHLAEFPTGVPTLVDFNTDEKAPAFHDGEAWYTQSSANQQFTP